MTPPRSSTTPPPHPNKKRSFPSQAQMELDWPYILEISISHRQTGSRIESTGQKDGRKTMLPGGGQSKSSWAQRSQYHLEYDKKNSREQSPLGQHCDRPLFNQESNSLNSSHACSGPLSVSGTMCATPLFFLARSHVFCYVFPSPFFVSTLCLLTSEFTAVHPSWTAFGCSSSRIGLVPDLTPIRAYSLATIVQSLNSTFFPSYIGAEPWRAKEQSRITCMRMLRTRPFFPLNRGKTIFGSTFQIWLLARFSEW